MHNRELDDQTSEAQQATPPPEAEREDEVRRREAARARRAEKQHRRKEAQIAEQIACKKRQDAVLSEEAQNRLHALANAACAAIDRKLEEVEDECAEAKRRWIEAMDTQARLVREAAAARSKCEDVLKQRRIAEARRRIAELQETLVRSAREQAEREEEEEAALGRAEELEDSVRRMEELRRIEEKERFEEQCKAREAAEAQRKKVEAERLEAERKMREDREHFAREVRDKAARRGVEIKKND